MSDGVLFASSLGPPVEARTSGANSRDEQIVCLQNIGPTEQRRRLVFGVWTLVAGLVIGSLLILTGINHWWRLILFVPFAGGAIGFFQARDKT